MQADRGAIAFQLRNARAGEAYAQPLVPQSGATAGLAYTSIEVPPALGLVADLASGTLAGTPLAPGEYEIGVQYRLAGAARRASARLVVTPDPRTLWKDLPSDRSDPYWRDDAACASAGGAGLRVLAASKRGRSHAHVGAFRDDDCAIGHLGATGWSIAVVADGAGSARYSRRGAQLVCEAALRHLRHALGPQPGAAIDAAAAAFHADPSARQALHHALFAAVGHAAFHGASAIAAEVEARAGAAALGDFHSTALIAICKRYRFGTLCAGYWVGDGAVGVYTQGKEIVLLGDADSGEYAGQTRFLDAAAVTQEALMRRTRFALVERPTALMLMTDGVSDPKFDSEASLGRIGAWDALWTDLSGVADERGLLSWLDFWAIGNHDDRTIAIIRQETTP